MQQLANWILGLLVFGMGWGCSLGKSAQRENPETAARTVTYSADSVPDQIQLLVFRLTHDSTTALGERCELLSKQVFKGRLKRALAPPAFVQVGDLICNFYDREGKVLSTQVVEDPLTASVEAAEPDGTLKRHTIYRPSAELPLRVQLQPALYQLVIGKVMPDQSIATLLTLDL